MDYIIDLPDLNSLFESYVNNNNELMVYTESLNEFSYDFHISTKCITTASAIRYLTSQKEWKIVKHPSNQLYQISIHYINDDLEDFPVHCFIVHETKIGQAVYQSFYGKYPLRKFVFNNLGELISDVKENWKTLTTIENAPSLDIKIVYHEPENWSESELEMIPHRYKKLIITK